MMLAAPELIIAERIELFDQIEVAAELQHRVLADRMMRGEEGSEFQARHDFSPNGFCCCLTDPKLRGRTPQGKSLSVTKRSWHECLPCAQPPQGARSSWSPAACLAA